MTQVQHLVDRLRGRSGLTVEDQAGAWLVRIPKQSALVCEITIPRDRFEWFASIRSLTERKELWKDWMDHYGEAKEKLDSEMAECIAQFVERALSGDLRAPLRIYEPRT